MGGVILFGTGSPLLVDVDESLHRAGCRIAAGIRNWPGPDHLPEGVPTMVPDELASDLLDFALHGTALHPEAPARRNKLSIFNPNAVRETGFAVGRHAADPHGRLHCLGGTR
jgi:hypothetical protein